VFSIFYLGIHWFLDAVAGTLLALISVKLARHLALTPVGRLSRAFRLHDNTPPSRF
jgi:membrane-associated phospholipid phosphatase